MQEMVHGALKQLGRFESGRIVLYRVSSEGLLYQHLIEDLAEVDYREYLAFYS